MADYYCTEDKLKSLVSTYGAAVTSIYASDPDFGNYGNGVFAKCSSNPTNHAVLVPIQKLYFKRLFFLRYYCNAYDIVTTAPQCQIDPNLTLWWGYDLDGEI
jgi:hypothetical protein